MERAEDKILTNEDINILLEAVDAWLARGLSGYMMSTMISAIAIRDPEERKKAMQEEKDCEKSKEAEKAVEKERAIVLKAKLLMIRDKKYADELAR